MLFLYFCSSVQFCWHFFGRTCCPSRNRRDRLDNATQESNEHPIFIIEFPLDNISTHLSSKHPTRRDTHTVCRCLLGRSALSEWGIVWVEFQVSVAHFLRLLDREVFRVPLQRQCPCILPNLICPQVGAMTVIVCIRERFCYWLVLFVGASSVASHCRISIS